MILVRELLERLELRLLDEERREDAREHEEREDLEPVYASPHVVSTRSHRPATHRGRAGSWDVGGKVRTGA